MHSLTRAGGLPRPLPKGAGETTSLGGRIKRSGPTKPNCSVSTAAERIGVTRRTLNRKMAAAGTTFHHQREDARRELACQLLENTHTAVTEIATILGYTDPASFTRTFQRWTGSPPTQWRANRRR